jgi:hypothetical protein
MWFGRYTSRAHQLSHNPKNALEVPAALPAPVEVQEIRLVAFRICPNKTGALCTARWGSSVRAGRARQRLWNRLLQWDARLEQALGDSFQQHSKFGILHYGFSLSVSFSAPSGPNWWSHTPVVSWARCSLLLPSKRPLLLTCPILLCEVSFNKVLISIYNGNLSLGNYLQCRQFEHTGWGFSVVLRKLKTSY